MIEKSVSELKLVRNREPIQSIEVRSDGLDLSERLRPVLRRYAQANPDQRATIYLFGSMSTTFHERAWSDFLIVDGPDGLRRAIHNAFAHLPGVQRRFSDAIAPSKGQSILHIEDGRCWRVLDAVTWGTESVDSAPATAAPHPESQSVASDTPADAKHSAADDWDDIWSAEGADEGPDAAVQAEGKRGRLRAARSDARLGAIKRTIESVFGLPEGSVLLCGPDKKPLRADATVGTLRSRWD